MLILSTSSQGLSIIVTRHAVVSLLLQATPTDELMSCVSSLDDRVSSLVVFVDIEVVRTPRDQSRLSVSNLVMRIIRETDQERLSGRPKVVRD